VAEDEVPDVDVASIGMETDQIKLLLHQMLSILKHEIWIFVYDFDYFLSLDLMRKSKIVK
jgi:hypothetical protein